MLTSLFDDTPVRPSPSAAARDESIISHSVEARDRRPAWIAPAVGVAVVGGVAAAALLLASGPGRDAASTDIATATLPTASRMPETTPAPFETATLSAAVDPNAAEPRANVAPARRAQPAPRAAAAPPPTSETVTSAPADSPAPTPDLPPSAESAAPAIVPPPAAETPVAPPAPAAPTDSAPADAPPAVEVTPPVTPVS